MRASGRSGSETLMFIAPAVIVGAFVLWSYGDPKEALAALDRMVLHGVRVAAQLCGALVEALSRL